MNARRLPRGVYPELSRRARNDGELSINIGGIETFSIVDFPNKAAAVVFMQGCPWRCPFCYNTSLQPINSEAGADWNKFLELLNKRKGLLDAVVFSGGEPLVQEGLIDAIKEVKQLGYLIGLHTGGYRPELLEKVLPLVDWIGFDIKAPFDNEKYLKAIGFVTPTPTLPRQGGRRDILTNIQTSLDLILNSGKDFECRTTCDPRILTIEDIYKIAQALKEKGVKKYHLQKYRPVEGDTTDESECLKFFQDKNLIDFLKSNFEEVDLRK